MQMFHIHSLGGSTALCCMKDAMATAVLNLDNKIKYDCQLMHIYTKNHSCQISRSDLKRRALGFFLSRPNNKNR